MINTVVTITETLQPYIIYIALAAIVFLMSRIAGLRKLLWTPVVITGIYFICLFALKVAEL